MSVFAIEYHSYYAYLCYDFARLTKAIDEGELAQIDAIALKYVKMSFDAGGDQSRYTQNYMSGHIIVQRAYLPALLEELLPLFEKIESAKE